MKAFKFQTVYDKPHEARDAETFRVWARTPASAWSKAVAHAHTGLLPGWTVRSIDLIEED